MIRVGECSHCGECCAPDPTASGPLPHFSDAELNDPERVEGYCPLFRRDRDGRSSCTGHGWHPFYLGGCQRHPTQPVDLVATPSCSYTFVRAA